MDDTTQSGLASPVTDTRHVPLAVLARDADELARILRRVLPGDGEPRVAVAGFQSSI